MAKVLRTIGSSGFDLQRLLDVLTASSAKAVGADLMAILRRHGDSFHYVPNYNIAPKQFAYIETIPHRPGCGSLMGMVLERGATVHLPDVLAEPDYRFHEVQRLLGFRSMLGVPMLREGVVTG